MSVECKRDECTNLVGKGQHVFFGLCILDTHQEQPIDGTACSSNQNQKGVQQNERNQKRKPSTHKHSQTQTLTHKHTNTQTNKNTQTQPNTAFPFPQRANRVTTDIPVLLQQGLGLCSIQCAMQPRLHRSPSLLQRTCLCVFVSAFVCLGKEEQGWIGPRKDKQQQQQQHTKRATTQDKPLFCCACRNDNLAPFGPANDLSRKFGAFVTPAFMHSFFANKKSSQNNVPTHIPPTFLLCFPPRPPRPALLLCSAFERCPSTSAASVP